MPRRQIANPGRVPDHNLYDLRQRFPGTGDLWFVDSNASSGGTGLSPESAVRTIDEAINLCTASNGDVIFPMEGHAETLTTAAAIALDLVGVTICGLGRGRNRPVITFATDNAASFNISGASCWVENLVLLNAKDGQTAMVNVSGADCTIKNCEIQHGDDSTQAVLGILTTDGADRLRIEDCFFHGTGTAGTTAAIRIVGTDHIMVRRNVIMGAYALTGAIEQLTTAGVLHLYEANQILNITANADNLAINLKSDTSALIANNRIAVIDATTPAPVTAAAGYVSGNFTTGAAGVTASTLM